MRNLRAKCIPWDEVLFLWEAAISRVCPAAISPSFHSVVGDTTVRAGVADWWPKDEVAKRAAIVAGGTIGGHWYWRTSSGEMTTAEMLLEHRNDKDMVAAILLAAWTHMACRDVPEHWRGPVYEELNWLRGLALKHIGSNPWHHAARSTLPNTAVLQSDGLSPMLEPDVALLVKFAVIDVAVSFSSWSLISTIKKSPLVSV